MVLLGDVALLEARFDPFRDSAHLDTPDGLLGDLGHLESLSVRLETVLVLLQDRCMVCAIAIGGSPAYRWQARWYFTWKHIRILLQNVSNSRRQRMLHIVKGDQCIFAY
jgi:hypothetical protein